VFRYFQLNLLLHLLHLPVNILVAVIRFLHYYLLVESILQRFLILRYHPQILLESLEFHHLLNLLY
jgi:hypothetical protein